MQDVASVELQVSVEAVLNGTVVGFAEMVTVGSGGGTTTVTVADADADPAGPVQERLYVVLEESGPVDSEPEVAFPPVHPPDAVQEVRPRAEAVGYQFKVDEPPGATELGLAVKLMAGSLMVTISVSCAEPPALEHSSVTVSCEVSSPLPVDPESATATHEAPPLYVYRQEVALEDPQVNVVSVL